METSQLDTKKLAEEMLKGYYRKYRIEGDPSPDDINIMSQVICKFFENCVKLYFRENIDRAILDDMEQRSKHNSLDMPLAELFFSKSEAELAKTRLYKVLQILSRPVDMDEVCEWLHYHLIDYLHSEKDIYIDRKALKDALICRFKPKAESRPYQFMADEAMKCLSFEKHREFIFNVAQRENRGNGLIEKHYKEHGELKDLIRLVLKYHAENLAADFHTESEEEYIYRKIKDNEA